MDTKIYHLEFPIVLGKQWSKSYYRYGIRLRNIKANFEFSQVKSIKDNITNIGRERTFLD